MKLNLIRVMEILQKPLAKRAIALVVAVAVFHTSLAIAEPSRGAEGFGDTLVEAEPAKAELVKIKTIFSAFTARPEETDARWWEPALPQYDLRKPEVARIAAASNGLPPETNFIAQVSGLNGQSAERRIIDKMNKRFQYNKEQRAIYVDLLFPDVASAKQFGRRTGYVIILN